MRLRPDLAKTCALLGAGLLVVACGREEAREAPLLPPPETPSARGQLVVSLYGGEPAADPDAPLSVHTTRFANGALEPALWEGMEDNDVRGYLDGTFKWGWNQPGQVHVRIGRRDVGPRYGEQELFRVLQRWSALPLPAASEVLDARLSLEVEFTAEWPVRLLLYAVQKDWRPGGGGALQDNVSPPLRGEVWWNDVGFGERAWALPGASFASDHHPEADTGAQPLAEATVSPGASRVELAGERLRAYAAERVRANAPLLFLLKVDDGAEDRPGSRLGLYSGNADDRGNPTRRPALVLRWRSAAERARLARPLHLEYGRSTALPALATRGAERLAFSFEPEPEAGLPSLALDGDDGEPRWIAAGSLAALGPAAPERLSLRARAAARPHRLGASFRPRIRDTWVRTAPPERQEVRFTFVAPSGRRVLRSARYLGDTTWQADFAPDEPGPWRYSFAHELVEPVESPAFRLDVVATELAAVTRALDALAEDAAGGPRAARASLRLMALERAGLALLTPESWRDTPGRALRTSLARAREAIHTAPPSPLPLEPTTVPEWDDSPPERDYGAWEPERTPYRAEDATGE